MSNPKTRPIVLIVDDEHAIRDMLTNVLKLEGWSLELASNGQEAIDTLEKTPATQRIMLLDLFMPVVDGWGVVRWLVEHADVKAHTKVILMSANERLRQASDLEHDGELEKPFGVDALLAMLDKFA
jgi:two-component system, OmpR family, response regulator MprA